MSVLETQSRELYFHAFIIFFNSKKTFFCVLVCKNDSKVSTFYIQLSGSTPSICKQYGPGFTYANKSWLQK